MAAKTLGLYSVYRSSQLLPLVLGLGSLLLSGFLKAYSRGSSLNP